ncbi:DUF4238 domain-containing protein [Kluyvera ascorbata]|nr:DUF4238 domain-containing protein [Kluyvera ascorbata]
MTYTKNQHVLSQWVLRNFRSDDTALSPKDKQRVWCHGVVPSDEGKNDIKDIPLPISSVAICKDCFRLKDGDTGEFFDIENELSEYENEMSILVRELVQNHQFYRLANCSAQDFPVEKLASFAIFQMILNLNNPQSGFPDKKNIKDMLLTSLKVNIDEHISSVLALPDTQPDLASEPIYKKLMRIALSSSDVEDKAHAMFVIYSLLALQKKPTPDDAAAALRDSMFSGIYSIDVFHTGHDFNSTEPRPVFTVSPNIFCLLLDDNVIYLPLSHNLALRFNLRPGHGFYSDPKIRVFSPQPQNLSCVNDYPIMIYHCSYDYIDVVVSTIDTFHVGFSNIIYSSWQLSDVENYIGLQEKFPDKYYLPENPVIWPYNTEG